MVTLAVVVVVTVLVLFAGPSNGGGSFSGHELSEGGAA